MKMTVVFEVPDGQADAYAEVAEKMIRAHRFATEQGIEHWSFHQEMRPVGVLLTETEDADLTAAVAAARREIDQEHPWVPGGVFKSHPQMKSYLLWALDLIDPS